MTFDEWYAATFELSGDFYWRREVVDHCRRAWDAATLLADRPIQLVGVHYNPEEFHEGQP